MVFPALGVLLFTPPTAVFMDVDESTIPEAGLGLFSLVARPIGFHLVDYLGEIVSNTVIEQRYPKKTLGAYSLKLSASLFLDSALSRGVGACANAPGKGMRPNVCFVAHAGSKRSARSNLARRSLSRTVEIIGEKQTRPTSRSMFLTGSGISPILLPCLLLLHLFLSPLLRRLLLPLHLWFLPLPFLNLLFPCLVVVLPFALTLQHSAVALIARQSSLLFDHLFQLWSII